MLANADIRSELLASMRNAPNNGRIGQSEIWQILAKWILMTIPLTGRERGSGRASERPGLQDLWPTRLLASSWQNGFLMTSPLDGESENRRVYIGDLNGGPGWT